MSQFSDCMARSSRIGFVAGGGRGGRSPGLAVDGPDHRGPGCCGRVKVHSARSGPGAVAEIGALLAAGCGGGVMCRWGARLTASRWSALAVFRPCRVLSRRLIPYVAPSRARPGLRCESRRAVFPTLRRRGDGHSHADGGIPTRQGTASESMPMRGGGHRHSRTPARCRRRSGGGRSTQ